MGFGQKVARKVYSVSKILRYRLYFVFYKFHITTVLFTHAQKTSEKLWFSDISRGGIKGFCGMKRVNGFSNFLTTTNYTKFL